MLPEAFFNRPAETVARDLIGVDLRVDDVGGIIVETEAYDAFDPASHSFGGPTPRNAPMFGPPARAYVYRIYGLHWCFNFVCDAAQPGSAVLIRALEPRSGLEVMRRRRGVEAAVALCSGPGKLCEALNIDGRLNGADLFSPPLALGAPAPGLAVIEGARIGVNRGAEAPWRFGLAGSRYLSRPLRAPEAIL
jgi:DNA-3-methyladenine glycosylase